MKTLPLLRLLVARVADERTAERLTTLTANASAYPRLAGERGGAGDAANRAQQAPVARGREELAASGGLSNWAPERAARSKEDLDVGSAALVVVVEFLRPVFGEVRVRHVLVAVVLQEVLHHRGMDGP